jgi:hypothetical protein
VSDVNVTPSTATGWPTVDDLAAFLTNADKSDPALQWAIDKAVSYGADVLGDRYIGQISPGVFGACLDYAGSAYVERVGQNDIVIEGLQGSSISLARYRRFLQASRFTAIA